MMFSSPAIESDSAGKRQYDSSDASMIKESVAYVDKANTSFEDIGDGILLDNSVCNIGREVDQDERKPITECTSLEERQDDRSQKNDKGFVIFQS